MDAEHVPSESDHHRPAPVLNYSSLPRPKPRTTFGGQIIAAALIGTGALLLDTYSLFPRMPFLYGLIVWLIVIAAALLRARKPLMWDVPEGPRWRPVVAFLFLLSFMIPVHVHQCDHATTFGTMMHIGLSYSRRGGPCHNRAHAGGRHLVGNWYLGYQGEFHWG